MPKHPNTPKRAKIKGAYEFLEAKKLPYFKTELFEHFEVSRTTGYRILNDPLSRMRQHQPDATDNRGGKRKQDHYEEGGSSMTYGAGSEAGSSSRNNAQHPSSQDLYTRLAEQVEYKSKADCHWRLVWTNEALAQRPDQEDWHDVLFSEENHFDYDDDGRALDLERREPGEGGFKRLHCWAAFGHGFKSPLVWYEVPDHTTQAMYEREMLEPYIQRWLGEGKSFALEEDVDDGHGAPRSNPVRAWKERHGSEHFFNCPGKSDMSPIQSALRVSKEYIRQDAQWDEEMLKDLAEEGWDDMQQSTIDDWVGRVPQRLRDVQKSQGKMTGRYR